MKIITILFLLILTFTVSVGCIDNPSTFLLGYEHVDDGCAYNQTIVSKYYEYTPSSEAPYGIYLLITNNYQVFHVRTIPNYEGSTQKLFDDIPLYTPVTLKRLKVSYNDKSNYTIITNFTSNAGECK